MGESAPSIHGVLNVLKPPGMTSHDVVSLVRRRLGTKRVGHTGTLDPAAAGVLTVCIGQATRLIEYLPTGKEYTAEISFGYETDTCDAVGQTIKKGDAGVVTTETLEQVLEPFRGTITQTPPMHSAVKVGGRKLYELARNGETAIEIPTREVHISRLQVTKYWSDASGARAMMEIECSGGTYIRSLVRDIGRALGCGATMTFLVRTRNGSFALGESCILEAIENDVHAAITPITQVLGWCAETVIEDETAVHALAQGRFVDLTTNAQRVLVWNPDRSSAALATPVETSGHKYKADKAFLLGLNS
jgi:tRNA pseudouridine55 synthase